MKSKGDAYEYAEENQNRLINAKTDYTISF